MAEPSPSPFRLRAEGLAFALRLTPKASRNAVTGIASSEDGELYLKATVTTVPEDGKANAALCKLLAKLWKLAPGSITVTSGLSHRNKQLLIKGGDAALKARLESWMKTA